MYKSDLTKEQRHEIYKEGRRLYILHEGYHLSLTSSMGMCTYLNEAVIQFSKKYKRNTTIKELIEFQSLPKDKDIKGGWWWYSRNYNIRKIAFDFLVEITKDNNFILEAGYDYPVS